MAKRQPLARHYYHFMSFNRSRTRKQACPTIKTGTIPAKSRKHHIKTEGTHIFVQLAVGADFATDFRYSTDQVGTGRRNHCPTVETHRKDCKNTNRKLCEQNTCKPKALCNKDRGDLIADTRNVTGKTEGATQTRKETII